MRAVQGGEEVGRAKSRPVGVETCKHDETRANIPTEELREFAPDVEQAQPLLWPRDPSLDPQLVWKGKDEQDRGDLAVPVVPVYIQEKIQPRAIIEDLRAVSTGDAPPQLSLFSEDFNGLDFDKLVEFYQHEQSWTNRMILGDSLVVMSSLAEKEGLRGKVQTIYMDPPYGIKFGSNWQASTAKRDVKDGSAGDFSQEPEVIRAFRDTWELGINSYLAYLRDRLVVARDLLTESGSIFVQIGDENVHLVRSLLDEVFGSTNFSAQITFAKTASFSSELLSRSHDYLLWYARDRDRVKYRGLLSPLQERTAGGTYTWLDVPGQPVRRMTRAEIEGAVDLPPNARRFRAADITSPGASAHGSAPVVIDGTAYMPSPGTHWKTTSEGILRLALAGRVSTSGKRLGYRRYSDDFPWMSHTDVWDDTIIGTFTEKVYVVQTGPLAVQRCILMTTDPGGYRA